MSLDRVEWCSGVVEDFSLIFVMKVPCRQFLPSLRFW